MITQTFGDMLFCPAHENLEEFPSPEELKYRIIISTKPPKEYLKSKSVRENSKNSLRSKDSDEDEWGNEVTDVAKAQNEDDKVDYELHFIEASIFSRSSDHVLFHLSSIGRVCV